MERGIERKRGEGGGAEEMGIQPGGRDGMARRSKRDGNGEKGRQRRRGEISTV